MAGEVRSYCLLPLLPVFGIDRKARDEVVAAGEDRPGRETVYLEQAWRSIEIVGGDDPVPESFFARSRDERVALLRGAQGSSSFLYLHFKQQLATAEGFRGAPT